MSFVFFLLFCFHFSSNRSQRVNPGNFIQMLTLEFHGLKPFTQASTILVTRSAANGSNAVFHAALSSD